MSLEDQISTVRKEIKPDGYDMSVGEIMNLYRNNELVISPAYQRLFRWEPLQKTRFIESLLLGIPIPPIFVFQSENGVWELIDGLQRLSTVLEFAGILGATPSSGEDPQSAADANDVEPTPAVDQNEPKKPVTLLGTSFLPDLENKAWEPTKDGLIEGIGSTAQLYIRRARLRVEILRQEGDPTIKYELFQRLNTGGTKLSEQEVRNCTAIMIDSSFHDWLVDLASDPSFVATTQQTEIALRKQAGTELALRFVAFRHVPYKLGLDVHEYLDKALMIIASNKGFDRVGEGQVFRRTFALLNRAQGTGAFKRWDGAGFIGKFLMSLYEVIAIGVASNLDAIEALGADGADRFIADRAKALWNNQEFLGSSGAGVRGTTRLAKLLNLGEPVFRP
jgi:hypothetical protein